MKTTVNDFYYIERFHMAHLPTTFTERNQKVHTLYKQHIYKKLHFKIKILFFKYFCFGILNRPI